MLTELLMTWGIVFVVGFVFLIGFVAWIIRWLHKIEPGTALVRTGMGGMRAYFSKAWVLPVIHQAQVMDISVKRLEIHRHSEEGLICQDNIRADIKVAFFVRVNNTEEDVLKVAQAIGCERASEHGQLEALFDSKFSEALKTIGKQFDFVQLYNERDNFKEHIIRLIGTDLNGYILEDVAIDYLEQTRLDQHDPNNILDAEGIKKITELTAAQQMLANEITRNKEKTIKKQDVEARETILELERQQAEAEERQRREIATITARERAEAAKVQEEERLRSERARIATDEEVNIAEQNRDRQVLVAQRNKERTDGVEQERVTRDREMEATEREKVVGLARIEKEKAIELEKRQIQDAIRERVIVERAVVEEQEKIKDTEAFAGAERARRVAVTEATQEAEAARAREVTRAQAGREAAEHSAQEQITQAEGFRVAAEKETVAKKMLAEATAAEAAATGLAEVQVMEARADAVRKQGQAEADVMSGKFSAEARGITEKAEAMKLFDAVGKEHEEFKLRLEKTKEIELAEIAVRGKVAAEQARLVAEALGSANIDIVGGEMQFFDKIVQSITVGKMVDRAVENSQVLGDVKATFFDGDGMHFKEQLRDLVDKFNLTSEDLKNLSLAALLGKLLALSDNDATRSQLSRLLDLVRASGAGDRPASTLGLTREDL